jgi:hypothetical protein
MNLAWRKAVRDTPDRRVDSSCMAVAIVLDTYANKEGFCWPSRATIAAGAKLTDKPVDQAIRRLEAAGFLVVSRSRGRTSNTYRLTFPNSGVAPPLTTEVLRRNSGAGDPVTTELEALNHGAATPLTGSNQSSNPTLNPVETAERKSHVLEPANDSYFAEQYQELQRRLSTILPDIPS